MTSSIAPRGLLLVALAFVALGSSSLAQAQDAFDAHVADIIILQPKQIQEDVGITLKQRDKFNQFADEQAKSIHAYIAEQEKNHVSRSKISPSDKHVLAIYLKLKTQILTVLTPAQLRRLREITLQARGYPLILDPVIERRMGVTPNQAGRIKSLLEAFAKFAQNSSQAVYEGVRAKFTNPTPTQAEQTDFSNKVRAAEAAIRPKIAAAHVQMDREVDSILTPAQRQTWKALLGKPFKSA
jgi:hypothetical protein